MSNNTKLIREGRFGPPKSYKTGAIVNSYPRPMLVLEGDQGGLDVSTDPPLWLPQVEDLVEACQASEQPPLSAFSYTPTSLGGTLLDETTFSIPADPEPYRRLAHAVNALTQAFKESPCPWKTVVLDPITAVTEAAYRNLSTYQPDQLKDPRKWSPSVALKVKQVIEHLATLPCHFVFIMHARLGRNELTGEINYEPIMYSDFRNLIGAIPSQFFFADIRDGEAVVLTSPEPYVKGVGARWPAGLPSPCGATYQEIYERP